MIAQEPEGQHSEKESPQVDAGCEERIARVPMIMYLRPNLFSCGSL